MIHDGIRAGGKHSYEDFGLEIASREIGLPEKKSIRKTVPFMNGFYDFTTLNGAPAWGERQIKYTFDLIGATVEEMDAERTEVINWLCNLHDVDIFDDSIPDYHFRGSYDSYSLSEDGEYVELTVVFVCYPFMLSNVSVSQTFTGDGMFAIVNNGQQTKLMAKGKGTIMYGTIKKSFDAAELVESGFYIPKGMASVSVALDNLLGLPFSTTANPATSNGITYTKDDSNNITASGTATDTSWFYCKTSSMMWVLRAGRYYAKMCPSGGSSTTYRVQITVVDSARASKVYYDYGSGVYFDVPKNVSYIGVAIRILSGVVADSLVFTPKIYADTVLSYSEVVL